MKGRLRLCSEIAWLLGGAGLGAGFPFGKHSSPLSLEQGLAWHHCCLAGNASSHPRGYIAPPHSAWLQPPHT